MAETGPQNGPGSETGANNEPGSIPQASQQNTEQNQENDEPGNLQYFPKKTRKGVEKYLLGFAKIKSFPALSERKVPGRQFINKQGREKINFETKESQAEGDYVRYLLKKYEATFKRNDRANPDELIRYLRARAEHKAREALGDDPNVKSERDIKRAQKELDNLNRWVDSLGGSSVSDYHPQERGERQRRDPNFHMVHTPYDMGTPNNSSLDDFEASFRNPNQARTANRSQQPREERQEFPAPPIPDSREQQDSSLNQNQPPVEPSETKQIPQPSEEGQLSLTPERERQIAEGVRAIADQIIMHHFPVDQIIAMNAEGKTKEEIDKAFAEAAKTYLQNIATHRKKSSVYLDHASGQQYLVESGDLDGESVAGLWRMAGIRVSVRFVNAGGYVPGILNVDTGGKPGIELGAEGEEVRYNIDDEIPPTVTAFADHHGKFAPRDICGTYLGYEILNRLSLLEKTPALDKAVWLVNELDNGRLPTKHYSQSYKTVWGLADYMRFEDLVDFYEKGGRSYDELSQKQLEQYNLIIQKGNIDRTKETKRNIDRNLRSLEGAKRGRRIFSTPFGKILVAGNVAWEARDDDFDCSVQWDNENGENLTMASERNFPPQLVTFLEQNNIPVVKPNMAVKRSFIVPGEISFSLGELLQRLGVTEQDLKDSRYVREEVQKDKQRVEKLRQGA